MTAEGGKVRGLRSRSRVLGCDFVFGGGLDYRRRRLLHPGHSHGAQRPLWVRWLRPGALALDAFSDLTRVMESLPLTQQNAEPKEPTDLTALPCHLQRPLRAPEACEGKGVTEMDRKMVPR
jgi:hypothetical protein